MIETKVVETKHEVNGIRYTHITLLLTIRTEPTGVSQKHIGVYSGPDNHNAVLVRRDLETHVKK